MPKPTKGESKQSYLSRCTKDLVDREGRKPDQAFAVCNSFWDASKVAASKPLTLSANVQLELAKAADDATTGGTFMMTAYTGQVMDFGWAGRYIFDLKGMSAKPKIPILRQHKHDRIIGHSTKAWAEGGNFLISGEFSKATRDAKEVLSLAQEGFPWQASVGISPKKIKTLDNSKETMVVNGQEVSGPIEIWLESKIGEVSFVALGADDDTAAIALTESESAGQERPPEGVSKMTLEDLKTQFPDVYQEIMSLGAATVDVKQLQADATEQGATAERARVTEIMTAGGDPEATQKAIKDGIAADAAYKLFFDAERAKRAEKLDALKASLPESAGASPKPKGDNAGTGFLAQVEQYRKDNDCSKTAALTAIAAKFPELHQAYVDSLNS